MEWLSLVEASFQLAYSTRWNLVATKGVEWLSLVEASFQLAYSTRWNLVATI
jgi:hypothetical protein